MEVKITDVTDILTRTVSKHGIIHGLDSFPERTVKIIILDIPDEPTPIEVPIETSVVPDSPYSDPAPEVVENEEIPEVPLSANRVVFARESEESSIANNESDSPYSDKSTTADHIRNYLSV